MHRTFVELLMALSFVGRKAVRFAQNFSLGYCQGMYTTEIVLQYERKMHQLQLRMFNFIMSVLMSEYKCTSTSSLKLMLSTFVQKLKLKLLHKMLQFDFCRIPQGIFYLAPMFFIVSLHCQTLVNYQYSVMFFYTFIEEFTHLAAKKRILILIEHWSFVQNLHPSFYLRKSILNGFLKTLTQFNVKFHTILNSKNTITSYFSVLILLLISRSYLL